MKKLKWTLMVALFTVGIANAATYNFYFNNTEQGENSTAEPKLIVGSSGEASKNEELKSTSLPGPVNLQIPPGGNAELPKNGNQPAINAPEKSEAEIKGKSEASVETVVSALG